MKQLAKTNGSVYIFIEEKNPLKQGLKQAIDDQMYKRGGIEEKNPLKQGLKPNLTSGTVFRSYIEEKNPLKQGLKPIIFIRIGKSLCN